MKAWRVLIPAVVLGLAACEAPEGTPGEDIVARAAGYDLEAQTAAEILAPQSELPNQPQVVQALADLWIQYYLLARAVAEDSTLSNIDLSPLTDRQVEAELVARLREQVIQVDTAISEADLRARYEAQLPGGRIRARHILLQFPEGATDAQVDSVRALAASLRSRIQAGEDFETLARQYSQDSGSAGSGGDLGTFGKGEMVPPFEEAAFALEVGELSDVVETTFGLHLIRVDERIVPSFEERGGQFRIQVQNQLVMEAESAYVAGLLEAAEIVPDTGSFERVRQVASDVNLSLSDRALNRTLVRYNGGQLTLGEYRNWLLTSPANVPPQVAAGSSDQIQNLLESLTRSEVLVNEARSQGMEVPSSRRDSIAEGIVTGVGNIAEQLGFLQITPEEGESLPAAADRVVRQVLVEIVQEGREVIPLQTIAFVLKDQFGARVYPAGINKTVELVGELRRLQTTAPVSPAAPADSSAPDTAGGQG